MWAYSAMKMSAEIMQTYVFMFEQIKRTSHMFHNLNVNMILCLGKIYDVQ